MRLTCLISIYLPVYLPSLTSDISNSCIPCTLYCGQYQGPTIVNLPAVTYCHEDLQTKTKLFDLSVVDTQSSQFVCVREDSRSTSVKAFDVVDMTGNKSNRR